MNVLLCLDLSLHSRPHSLLLVTGECFRRQMHNSPPLCGGQMSPWTKMEVSGAALCSPVPLGPGDHQSILSSLNSTVLNIFTRLESQHTCLLCLASFTLCHIPKSDSSESVPALPSESPHFSLDPFSSLLAVPGTFALLRQTVWASSHPCWFWWGEPFLVSTNLNSELFANTVFTEPLHQFSDKTAW